MALLAHLLSSFKQHEIKHDMGKSQKVGLAKLRVNNELKKSAKNIATHCSYGLVDKHDPFNLQAIIIGPSNTPFDGGIFFLSIHIPHNYPFKPPKIKFQTKVFHPNVSRDGTIKMDILSNNWTPLLTIDKILLAICSFLQDPIHGQDSCNFVYQLYSKRRNLYNKIAKEWTYKYAMF
ncbi:Ubiquitin-conjugating enzyme E2 D3 [Bienertia sinuspersici]